MYMYQNISNQESLIQGGNSGLHDFKTSKDFIRLHETSVDFKDFKRLQEASRDCKRLQEAS